MTKDEALRLALEKLTAASNYIETLGGVSKVYRMDSERLKAALEAKDEKPCPEFWDWLPKAYRDGNIGDEPRFTKYNMEVAFLAGKQSAALEAKYEPVAWMYDWIRHDGDFIQDWTTSDAESLRDTEPTIITNVRPLYATPQPCPTCEALARTVMMDQTGRDL